MVIKYNINDYNEYEFEPDKIDMKRFLIYCIRQELKTDKETATKVYNFLFNMDVLDIAEEYFEDMAKDYFESQAMEELAESE